MKRTKLWIRNLSLPVATISLAIALTSCARVHDDELSGSGHRFSRSNRAMAGAGMGAAVVGTLVGGLLTGSAASPSQDEAAKTK